MSVYLTELKANIALVKTLDENIEALKKLAKNMLEQEPPTIGMTAHYANENRHKEGSVSHPTEYLALYDPSEQVAKIYEEIRRLMFQKQRVLCWINIAKTALNFLSDRERIIVELRAFEELSWENVAFEYEDRTGESISDKTCNKVYMRALNRIEPFFKYSSTEKPVSITLPSLDPEGTKKITE